MQTDNHMQQHTARPPGRRPLLPCILLILGVLALTTPDPAHGQQPAKDQPAKKESIKLIVDYGDGVSKHFEGVPHREEMTVLDAMTYAQKHPHGIKFEYRGRAATALLTRIDDLENQGAGKNWLFRVNGELAQQSFAITPLEAGDTVLWKFEPYK